MADKKKVYVETSVISNLTARPSRDILNNARQLITKDWWTVACDRYSLFVYAVHIATAAISGMDYLVSWNCKHIANPETKPLIRATCESMGYHYPEIFTPYEIGG